MKNLLLSACCLLACPAALAATMASQPWVTNRIAEAVAAIPQPGNYATVSNRAMSALQSHQSLQPSTNYTEAVAADIRQSYIPIDGGPIFSTVELFLNNLLHEQGMLLLELPSGGSVDAAAFVGSTQITNQGAVAAATAMTARKQDALPYPTNAIPYAAIDGAPSGGGTPEWRVVQIDENATVSFVTNGIAAKLINGELYATTNGWPDGAAMFVRGSVVPGPYDIGEQIRLVGYGTWPTNDFQSVWWRSGATIYVNILVEE